MTAANSYSRPQRFRLRHRVVELSHPWGGAVIVSGGLVIHLGAR